VELDASPDIHGLIRRLKLPNGAIELLRCKPPWRSLRARNQSRGFHLVGLLLRGCGRL
jgi:hypothetical protein